MQLAEKKKQRQEDIQINFAKPPSASNFSAKKVQFVTSNKHPDEQFSYKFGSSISARSVKVLS